MRYIVRSHPFRMPRNVQSEYVRVIVLELADYMPEPPPNGSPERFPDVRVVWKSKPACVGVTARSASKRAYRDAVEFADRMNMQSQIIELKDWHRFGFMDVKAATKSIASPEGDIWCFVAYFEVSEVVSTVEILSSVPWKLRRRGGAAEQLGITQTEYEAMCGQELAWKIIVSGKGQKPWTKTGNAKELINEALGQIRAWDTIESVPASMLVGIPF